MLARHLRLLLLMIRLLLRLHNRTRMRRLRLSLRLRVHMRVRWRLLRVVLRVRIHDDDVDESATLKLDATVEV